MTTLNNCPYCKRELNGKFNVCPHCGGVLLETIGKLKIPTIDPPKIEKVWKTKAINPNKVFLGKYLIKIWRKLKRQDPMGVMMTMLFLLLIIGVIFGAIFGNKNDISSDSSSTTDNLQYNSDSPVIEATPKVAEAIILPENRLQNGEVIYKNSEYFKKYGAHKITIDNSDGGTDAIIKLVPVELEKSIYTTYIRKGDNYTINHIPDGDYYLYFAYCKGYDYGLEKALGLYGSQKSDHQYNLQTTNDGSTSHWTITLYTQINGNLTTTDVGESQFNDL